MEWLIIILLFIVMWMIGNLSRAMIVIQEDLDQLTKNFNEQSWGDESEESELHEDELYKAAEKIVVDAQTCSTSYLQRELKIGYARAANLIDLLERNGVVSPGDGVRPRKVINKE